MLIRLFQHNSICWDGVLVERPGKVCAAPYLLICGRLAPGPESKQGLERGHGLPPTIVAKDKFVEINLQLIAAHAVVGSDQPLLQVSNSAIGKRDSRLRALTEFGTQWLSASDMFEPRIRETIKAFEAIGVDCRARRDVLVEE